METDMDKVECRCGSCDLKSCCDFYQYAVKPVIEIVEMDCFDLYDPTTVAYLRALTGVVNDLTCDRYE